MLMTWLQGISLLILWCWDSTLKNSSSVQQLSHWQDIPNINVQKELSHTLVSWGMKWPNCIVVLLLVQLQWYIEIRHYQAKSRDPGDFGHFEPLKPDQSLLSHTGLGKKLLNVVVIASLTSVISWQEVQYNFAKVETLSRKCSKRVYILKFSSHPKWHLWACQCVPKRNRAFPSARAY